MKTSNPSRRSFLGASAAFLALPMLSGAAHALSASTAQTVVNNAVKDVNRAVNSGKSGAALYSDFEKLFRKHADINVIAAQTLGPPWRSLSGSEKSAYVNAFTGYISRKYGKQFREFVGSEIKVTNARKVKSFIVVSSTVKLRSSNPLAVDWQVSDRSGSHKIFNLIIEGISMVKSEREEIGALYERNGRKIGNLTAALKKAG